MAWTQVSPGFLSVIGVPPALGRGFNADEEQTGAPIAIVSYGYWQERLAGRSDFAGQSVRVNDRTYTVIGVMPRGYDFPAGTELGAPLQPMTHNRTAKGFQVVGRLRDDISTGAAQQDLSAIAVTIGLIVASVSTRVVGSWLYGVGGADPTTFAAVAVAMIAVTLAATWVPAYRASRADAMEALRHD